MMTGMMAGCLGALMSPVPVLAQAALPPILSAQGQDGAVAGTAGRRGDTSQSDASRADASQQADASPDTARGVLEPAAEAVISAEIAGRITDISVTEGASFAKGALLVRFDCTLYEAQLAQARAQSAGAKAELDNARSLARLQSIGQLEVQLAEARLAEASAAIRLHSATVERCRISAPYAGRVVARLAQPAEGVAAGDDLLAIVSDGAPRLRLIVPSNWLAWLQPGQRFSFDVDETGGTVQATVTAVGARVDQVSQTVAVLASIEEGGRDLLAGMSGTARFPAALRDPANRPVDPAVVGEPVPQPKPRPVEGSAQ
ncbi:efflux RND transporter periplasmic adaptor subunit [Tistrella sp. BH-R2-4]|uniref:Efflux RND transporter periplasmic adaptor subunit n=1 Tax=Tistrella arctica TaxID=3133430 RepID=A0ABU9YSD2_9PROT